MAESFVTGIAPTQQVDELEKMLGGTGLDNARISVITKAERGDEHERSFLEFVHTGGPDIDAEIVGGHIGASDSIMGGGGGTGVPGLIPHNDTYGHLDHPHVTQRVGDLPIPDDEADNYNDAIEDGRSVVAYKLNGDKDTAMAAFHTAGLQIVRAY